MRPVTGHAPGYFTRPPPLRPSWGAATRRNRPAAHHPLVRRVRRRVAIHTAPAGSPLALVPRPLLSAAGASLPGVSAAIAVDELINKVASPGEALALAAANPIFLGTGAVKGAVNLAGDVVSGVGDFLGGLFGGTHTLTTDEYVQLGKFPPGVTAISMDEVPSRGRRL